MPLTPAERFRIYKVKLKLEENKPLLQKFRENRIRQAKRRSKLVAEKKLRQQANQPGSSTIPTTSESSYKCVQTLVNAIHRSERALPNSPTKKKEIAEHLGIKHGVLLKTSSQPAPNNLSDVTKDRVVEFYQLDEISSVAPGKKDTL